MRRPRPHLHEVPKPAARDAHARLPLVRDLIHEHRLGGRVIMFSSIADPRERLEARRAGAARYPLKPPERAVLLAAVRAAVAHARVA